MQRSSITILKSGMTLSIGELVDFANAVHPLPEHRAPWTNAKIVAVMGEWRRDTGAMSPTAKRAEEAWVTFIK